MFGSLHVAWEVSWLLSVLLQKPLCRCIFPTVASRRKLEIVSPWWNGSIPASSWHSPESTWSSGGFGVNCDRQKRNGHVRNLSMGKTWQGSGKVRGTLRSCLSYSNVSNCQMNRSIGTSLHWWSSQNRASLTRCVNDRVCEKLLGKWNLNLDIAIATIKGNEVTHSRAKKISEEVAHAYWKGNCVQLQVGIVRNVAKKAILQSREVNEVWRYKGSHARTRRSLLHR